MNCGELKLLNNELNFYNLYTFDYYSSLNLLLLILELPRTANLFDSGMNNGPGLNQYNQVQFDSFVNDAPQQNDQFANPQSLPPSQSAAPPPVPNQGPLSLDASSVIFFTKMISSIKFYSR